MKQCPRCGHINRDEAKFCQHCSGQLVIAPASGKICPTCQTANTVAARFCMKCGQSLLTGPIGSQPISSGSVPLGGGLTGQLGTNALLTERYMIVRSVGRGGMGAVYEAVDNRLHSRVAVKEMSSGALTSAADRQMALNSFKKEAEMLAQLSHPNLPRVTDHFNDSGRLYMVMEFIEGETLDHRLEKRGALPETEVQYVADQLCGVLDYLHRQTPPIIFRDLKPANIMLQADGRVKLIDFGIVRHFDPKKSKDTHLLGTPGFAAPEAYNGQTDARSDIFSLGMTLYTLLTAKDPPDNIAAFQPHVDLSPVSANLRQAVVKAVEIRRDNRWNSISDMHAALTTDQQSSQNQSKHGTGTKVISGQSGSTGQPITGGSNLRRATQRLTQTIAVQVKQMSNEQLAGLVTSLVVGVGLLIWLLGPWLAKNMPLLWYYLPMYYAAGPFAYIVSNRRGATVLVHMPLHLLVVALGWPELAFFPQLLGAIAAGIGMEFVLSLSKNKETKVWYFVAALVAGISLAMMIFTMTGIGRFDIKGVIGAAITGGLVYGLNEIFMGVKSGVGTN